LQYFASLHETIQVILPSTPLTSQLLLSYLDQVNTREILDESHSFFFNVFFMTLQRWLHIFQTWTEEDP